MCIIKTYLEPGGLGGDSTEVTLCVLLQTYLELGGLGERVLG